MNIQTIDHDGKPAFVVVPVEEWNALLARLEERADVTEASRTLAAIEAGEEDFPADFAARLIGREHPLKVWREYRGLTLRALAVEVGVSPPALSKIETGKSRPRTATLSRLASALRCDMDDLWPASSRRPAGALPGRSHQDAA